MKFKHFDPKEPKAINICCAELGHGNTVRLSMYAVPKTKEVYFGVHVNIRSDQTLNSTQTFQKIKAAKKAFIDTCTILAVEAEA